ncbi:hypothetical protein HPP92_010929 [Vanilla planifolia]|uniref:C2H2-type domain-containing protein n=1 Tax=Vanilla planifolia TaxID=51239 RepID=A0A835V3Y9_VANPL|nr:hypothetical protein HPP92_010929 [Vanilla planifolia]
MATELIPVVDLRVLSQSELATLALSSPNAFDLRRCDDVVVPKIDRSVFNESAGSRKQTYSRLRLDPPKSDSQSSPPSLPRRRGRPRSIPLRSAAGTAASTTANAATGEPVASEDSSKDPDRRENLLIASFLSQLFSREDPTSRTLALGSTVSSVIENEKIECSRNVTFASEAAQTAIVLAEDGGREILNPKGEAVDLVALGQMVDPFGEELRRRTQGLRTEEQLLGFLSGLEGQWVSRRKRRRFVGASIFGDILPKGWKLMLGLKRKEGVAWLNCRRYVSPNGHQFVSCKEVSSYILSLHGTLPSVTIQEDEIATSSDKLTYGSNAGKIHHVISNGSSSFSSATPLSYVSENHQKQPEGTSCYNAIPISYISCGTENQHLFPSPRGYAKRRKRGKTIADGVIIRDGKYECQICHRTFTERHRYNGHVGAHVRYQGLNLEALANGSSTGKGTDQSSWALVPHSLENDFSAFKNDESLATPLVIQLKCASTFEGQAETSIAKSVVDAHSEVILEGVSTRIDPNECLESKFNSTSDLITTPQECSTVIAEEVSLCKMVDSEVKVFANASINAYITNDQKGLQEDSASDNAKSLLSNYTNNDITVATAVTDLPCSISKIVNINPVTVDRENASSESNNEVDISSTINKPDVSNFEYQTKVDGAACNWDEVDISLSKSKSVDYLSLASVNVENIACESIKVDGHHSSLGQSNAHEKSDCNSMKYTPGNVDDTSNFIDVDTNTCYELSLSLIDMDAKANGKHAEINRAHSNLTSEIEKLGDKLMVDVQNDFINLSGNLSSNGTETYAELCTEIIEERAQKPISKNVQVKSESQNGLSDNDASFPSRMYNTLQNSFSNVSFCGKYIQDIGTNTDCLLRADVNESMLQGIDRPVNELEMFFSNSNSDHHGNGADEIVTDDEANKVVQINLANSSWMQANNDLPILDMLPDRCVEELEDINEKNVNLQGFEELRLGSIEPSDFSLFTGQESRSLVEPSMALGFASELEDQQCSSLQLGWNISLSNMDNTSITCLCVWCNIEFRHDHVHLEQHLDTLGYICKACKEKFSGPSSGM